jgi:hypothetical protein
VCNGFSGFLVFDLYYSSLSLSLSLSLSDTHTVFSDSLTYKYIGFFMLLDGMCSLPN